MFGGMAKGVSLKFWIGFGKIYIKHIFMYSNYNVLTLPISADGKYKVGDIFYSNSFNWRIKQFDSLEIKYIDYCYGVRLHFDYKQWLNSKIT